MDTAFLERCILALQQALALLGKTKESAVEYDIYRSACIKEFEIILEQSGKLLRKTLKPYFHSSKEADKLVFKDVFRHAALHSIITVGEVERWALYRDNRNNTSHDYGIGFAEDTLKLLPEFIIDAKSVVKAIKENSKDA